jgi:transposase
MARPYFLDLRERVVALVARGETCRSVAAVFDVSVASVVKWSKSRATGSAAAKAMGGKRPHLLEGERSFLLGRLAEKPDLTLHALLSELRERGVAVSCDTLWRFLRRGGRFKKTLFASQQDRKKIPLRLDPRRLVFIDETIDETWAILRQAQDQ